MEKDKKKWKAMRNEGENDSLRKKSIWDSNSSVDSSCSIKKDNEKWMTKEQKLNKEKKSS